MKIRFDMKECVDFQLKLSGYKFDANETAAFARELEVIQAEAIEQKYPEYKFDALVPIKTDAPLGARFHTWRELLDFGEAEFLDNMTPEDFPTADVQGKENTGKFRSLGVKYMYSIEDLRAASSGMSINPEEHKGRIAKRVVRSRFDKAVFNGGGGFAGLAEDASSQNDTALAGVTANFATATAIQIADTFRAIADKVFDVSKGIYEGVDFVLSPKAFTFLGKNFDTTAGTTVADYVLSKVPRVRSISWSGRLSGVGGGGTDRLLAYPRSKEVVEAYCPIMFEQMPPQLRGMVFEIYCAAKYGGLRIYQPHLIRRADLTVA